MATWGPGLYQCDAALDLKALFKDWVRLPLSGPELLDVAKRTFTCVDDPESADHDIVWIALADQFHHYGIECRPVYERAAAFVDRSVRDNENSRRHDEFARLRSAWAVPHQQPAARRVLTGPEPHCVADGDVFIYPTEDGNPPNTNFPAKEISKFFAPNGWNAFVIAKTAHQYGYYSMCYAIRLHLESRSKPSLADCRTAPVSGVKYGFMDCDLPAVHAAAWTSVNVSILKKMQAEKAGSIQLSWNRVSDAFDVPEDISHINRGRVSGVLSVYHRTPDGNGFVTTASPLAIKLSDLTAG